MDPNSETLQDFQDNKLKTSRLKVINNLCQYAPFFLFPIVAAGGDYKWWILLISVIVVVCVGALYMNAFRNVFMPKEVRKDDISKGEKLFYYTMMIVCPVLSVIVYRFPPFGQLINTILAILVNFGLTMFLCYKVAAK